MSAFPPLPAASDNAAMSDFIDQLPLIGLSLGFIAGTMASRSNDPVMWLIYGGAAGVPCTVVGFVARFILAKRR